MSSSMTVDPEVEIDDGGGDAGDPGPTRARSFLARLAQLGDRPILATAVVGLVFFLIQAYWIHRARFVGALDVDEAGGIAHALRFHRLLLDGPLALVRGVFATGDGPLVPLLSVPFLLVGPRSVNTAMLAQPMLVVLAALGAAGATNRIAGPRAGTVAGIAVFGTPVMIVSSRSFQNSLGVAAFLSLALWALSSSDRARRMVPMVAFGAAVGAMLISRTMAIGFVPAVGGALLIVVAKERKVLLNIGVAGCAALFVAGPWWYSQWDYITGYLTENAYGDRASYWGPTELSGRFATHLDRIDTNFKLAFPYLNLLVLVLALVSLVGWYREHGSARSWPGWKRELLAVWFVWIMGYVALFSTSNIGYWFSTPLDVMMIVGLIGLATRSARCINDTTALRRIVPVLGALFVIGLILTDPRDGRWVEAGFVIAASVALLLAGSKWLTALGGIVVAAAGLTFLASLEAAGSGGNSDVNAPVRSMFVPDLDDVQAGNWTADGRLGSTDLADRRRAAAEWQDAADRLVDELVRLDSNGLYVETTVGSMHLFNTNTIGVAEELADRPVGVARGRQHVGAARRGTQRRTDADLRRPPPSSGHRRRPLAAVPRRAGLAPARSNGGGAGLGRQRQYRTTRRRPAWSPTPTPTRSRTRDAARPRSSGSTTMGSELRPGEARGRRRHSARRRRGQRASHPTTPRQPGPLRDPPLQRPVFVLLHRLRQPVTEVGGAVGRRDRRGSRRPSGRAFRT